MLKKQTLATLPRLAAGDGAGARSRPTSRPPRTAAASTAASRCATAGREGDGLSFGHLPRFRLEPVRARPSPTTRGARTLAYGGYRWANDLAVEAAVGDHRPLLRCSPLAARRRRGVGLGARASDSDLAGKAWNVDVYTSWEFRKSLSLYGRLGYAQTDAQPSYVAGFVGDAVRTQPRRRELRPRPALRHVVRRSACVSSTRASAASPARSSPACCRRTTRSSSACSSASSAIRVGRAAVRRYSRAARTLAVQSTAAATSPAMPDSSASADAAVTVRLVYLARLREAFGTRGEPLDARRPIRPPSATLLAALRARGGAVDARARARPRGARRGQSRSRRGATRRCATATRSRCCRRSPAAEARRDDRPRAGRRFRRRRARSPRCAPAIARVGAVASFIGTVRDVNDARDVGTMTLEHYPGHDREGARRRSSPRRARASTSSTRSSSIASASCGPPTRSCSSR